MEIVTNYYVMDSLKLNIYSLLQP